MLIRNKGDLLYLSTLAIRGRHTATEYVALVEENTRRMCETS